MERFGDWLVAGLLLLGAALHPHAASGAAIGCFFFLASPAATNRQQRLLLGIFSFGIGYAAGVFFYGGGPPFSPKAMLVSGLVAAFAAVVGLGFYRMAAGDGPLPQWLKDTLSFIPLFRRKGPDDGPR